MLYRIRFDIWHLSHHNNRIQRSIEYNKPRHWVYSIERDDDDGYSYYSDRDDKMYAL